MQASDTYRTITSISSGTYKDKGSSSLPGISCLREEEIKRILSDTRKEFHDAKHHCYAYILGSDGNNLRANDDNEPPVVQKTYPESVKIIRTYKCTGCCFKIFRRNPFRDKRTDKCLQVSCRSSNFCCS
jgi:hypothetical protein